LTEAKEEEARLKKAGEKAIAEAPVGPPPPEPPGTLPLKSTALAHDFMSVWAFAGSFMGTLVLTPFSPEMLCAALQRPGESVLLGELHVRLLRTLLAEFESLRKQQSPAPLDLAMLLQQVPPATAVSSANWPELLRNLGAVLPALFSSAEYNKGSGAGGLSRDVCAEALKRLQDCEYRELSLEHKLSLLRVLVDVVNNSVLLHDRTSENEKTQRQLVQKHKEFESELKKELNEARKAREDEAKQVQKQDASQPPASAKLDGSTVEGKRRKMATAALIEAIRQNDKENLLEAIDDAEQAGLSGASADGKRWASDELRAGRKLLLELDEREVRKEEDGRMGRKLAKQLRKHIERMHDASVRGARSSPAAALQQPYAREACIAPCVREACNQPHIPHLPRCARSRSARIAGGGATGSSSTTPRGCGSRRQRARWWSGTTARRGRGPFTTPWRTWTCSRTRSTAEGRRVIHAMAILAISL
jgi:hypothetical protein